MSRRRHLSTTSRCFLHSDKDAKRMMNPLDIFEALSGLKLQPSKSFYIYLNRLVAQKSHHGIPGLDVATSTRYLGI